MLHFFQLDANVTMETRENDSFVHDFLPIFYVLQATSNGKGVKHVLSDGYGVVVLVVYWVYWIDMQCKVQRGS